ncbi:NAD(P)/FAD-dependent oxidoreductase [Nocardioides sp. cx-173]|uniref:NAD(P)/FAD-dependent oxidoreductase n=1 Tax=Nocardioides sp. cx-173 TaxID=2898796 RepID=UPI001E2C0730|nr:FAD-dependent oxidoreductase [Nocardioides sp. cx-173]MCD4524217.1 FAD-dependent oxidoreductase [Nocardioides sp. cx-173]UGB41609.1 FAD-dependent oxidoreductase [Nocardioides sp. cx-173]
MSHIVVVGAGLAGVRTVQALRREGSGASVTLVGDELHPPYDRPPLSKDLLLGKSEPDDVRLLDDAGLAGLEAQLRLGVSATALDTDRRVVTLSSGEALRYDELVIATGARARQLPHGESGTPAGLHVLRSLEDAMALRDAFAEGPRVAVIGGGVIGCEVASSASMLGLPVVIIDSLPVLMQRVVGDVVAERVAALHRGAGVELRLGATVAGVDTEGGRVRGVRLATGEVVPADVVVVGIGAVPNVEWLEGSGLTLDDGVVSDEFLAAVGVDGVHVVGDVARWHHLGYGEAVRAEHWTAATEHATAVAKTLTGTPTSVAEIPYAWTDQHGRRFQIAGHVRPGDEVVFVVDEAGPPVKFLALVGSGGEQHAAVSIGAAPLFVKERMKMRRGEATWPPEAR